MPEALPTGQDLERILLLGHFAIDSYYGTPTSEGNGNLRGTTSRPVSGWEVIYSTEDLEGLPDSRVFFVSNSTFQGTAYRNTATSEVVVAFRGTDEGTSELTSVSIPLGAGISEDTSDINFASTESHLIDAYDFLASVYELQEVNKSDITLTGHSLGGIIAGVLGAITNLDAVTFDSGPHNLAVENFRDDLNLAPIDQALEVDYSRIENFRVAGEILQAGIDGAISAAEVGEVLSLISGNLYTFAAINFLQARFSDAQRMGEIYDELDAGNLDGATNLHAMALLQMLLYGQQSIGLSQFGEVPGFLQAFYDNDLAQNAGFSGPAASQQLFESVVLSLRDDSPDVLTPLLIDIDQKMHLAAQADYGQGFWDGNTGDIPAYLSQIAVEHAALAVGPFSAPTGYDNGVFAIVGANKWLEVDLHAATFNGQRGTAGVLPYGYYSNPLSTEQEIGILGSILDEYDSESIRLSGVNIQKLAVFLDDASYQAGPYRSLVVGGDISNSIFGSQFDDILVGNENADQLSGLNGNDILIAGGREVFSGNTLNGGDGFDLAVFSGNRSEYSINFDGNFTATVDRSFATWADTLIDVELIEFDDGFYDLNGQAVSFDPTSVFGETDSSNEGDDGSSGGGDQSGGGSDSGDDSGGSSGGSGGDDGGSGGTSDEVVYGLEVVYPDDSGAVTEPESGTVLPVSVRVTRSGENLQAETLYVSSVPGHSNNLYPAASAADGDYFGKIGSTESVVVFEEGQELGFAAFIVRPDNQTEGIEAFRLMLRDDQVNTTSDPLAIQNVFIRDNDSQTPPDDDSGDGGSGGDPGDGGSGGSGGGSADGGSNGVVVRIVDITSPNPTPGGSATVEIEVENTASTTKLVGTLGVYFSEDDTPSRSELVGTYSPGTVAPGDTEDRGVSFVIPDDASGTAKIIVIDQDELNDADQAAIQDFDINTPSNRANLEIGQHYMTDNTLIHGQRVEVEWDVLNTGTADSARSDVSLYLSKGRTFEEDRDIFLTNEFFGTNRNGIQLGIEAGDNDRESEFVTITADMVQQIEGDLVSDEFYLLYVIDEDRVVAESDRSDNVAYSRFSIAADEANLAGYTDHVVTDFNISTDRITFGERFYYDATIENDGRIDVTYGETLANIVWRSVEDGSEEIFGALFTDSNRQYQRNEPQFSSNGYILADGRLEPGYYDVFARVRTDEIERDDLLDNNESNALRVFVGGVDDMPGGTPDPALRDLSVTQSTDQSSVSVSFTAFNSGSGAYSDALIVTIAAVPSSGGNETEIDQLIVPGLLSLGDADGGDILYVSQPDIPLPATLADGEYDIVVYYDNPAGNAVTTNDRLVASSAVVIDADMGDGSGDQDTQEIVVQPGPAAGIDVAVTSVFWTDTNYGRDYELLRTGGWGDWYHSLLQFELPEFEGELVSAEIQLYSPEITDTRFSHDEVELYRVLGPWDESLGYYDTDRPTVEYVSTLAAPSDEAGWYSIDATTLVGDWIDGAIPNFGLQLETPRNDARLNDFYSSDYSVAELRPKLIIQYEPVSVEADRVTLIDEDFDDGVINSAPWIYSTDPQSSVAEVDGYLSLQQAVTDVRSWAQYDFENSIQDANIRFDAFYHDANDRLLATTRLELSASDGEDFTIDFGMVKNPYIGGLDGNPDNYDLPRVKVGDASGTDWYFSSGANTSTFLDQWTAVSIELDNTLGRLFIDVDSDGALEFDIQDDRFIDAELNSLYFNSYGWFTGHYVNIDNLTVTGVETEAADNPTNTAPVASNDVLVLTEDDMISDNVIAGIDGATADSDADGDPLEVVSLRDRDGNPLVLSELNALPEGGQLSVGADGAIDFDPAGDFESLSDGETATVLAEYEISDGTDTDVAQIEITIEGRNNAPVLVDPGPLQITENTADVAVISAFDAEEDSLGFSIEDSADSNLFMIDQSSGALSFVSPPDFEAPSDANGDNIYEIAVSATDSGGLSTTSPLTIAVTDIEESPVTTTDIRTFANGRVLETTFVDGIRVEATMTDVDDVYSWSSYTDTFDADGLRTSRLMQYDDGRTAETNYEAGVRSTVILTDLADEFVWNTVESSYDEEGQISEQVRIYDNERVLETTYVGGNRAEATMTDVGDAYSWTGYTDTFDSDGVRTDRLMQYDDGRIAETAYVSGVRSSSIVDDTGDQFNWKTIEQTFDESGQRDSRTVDYDNGRFMETSYIDGIRSEATMSDLGDVYRWSSYTDSFDFEGTRVSRIMTYDDGEEVVTNYVDDVA